MSELNLPPIPEVNTAQKEVPKRTTKKVPVPKVSDTTKPVPEYTEKIIEPPKVGNPQNCITVGRETIEIKPTKLKYQRDRTASCYHILQVFPLVQFLAMEDGSFGDPRSSDKMLFDWLVAVTDNDKFVTRHYDEFDTDIIDQLLVIFRRVNHIDEREEKRKNQTTQATNP